MLAVVKKIFSFFSSFLFFRISFPLVVFLILAGGVSWLTVRYAQKNPEMFGLVKGASIIKKEEDDLIKTVAKLIELPKDERPTIAEITEENKLKDQAFFAKAKNGDKVLIYTNAKQVYIYRPDENRVVSVGSVNISSDSGSQIEENVKSPSPSPAAAPKEEAESSSPSVEN